MENENKFWNVRVLNQRSRSKTDGYLCLGDTDKLDEAQQSRESV